MAEVTVPIPDEAWRASRKALTVALTSIEDFHEHAVQAAAPFIARAAVVAELRAMADKIGPAPGSDDYDPYDVHCGIAARLRSRANELEARQ